MQKRKLVFSVESVYLLLVFNILAIVKHFRFTIFFLTLILILLRFVILNSDSNSLSYNVIVLLLVITVFSLLAVIIDFIIKINTAKINFYYACKDWNTIKNFELVFDEYVISILDNKQNLDDKLLKWSEIDNILIINGELIIITPAKRNTVSLYIPKILLNKGDFDNILSIIRLHKIEITKILIPSYFIRIVQLFIK